MAYDLVIRNGTIVDGSGAAPYAGDVAIVGDRITEIGKVDDRGAHEIDAEGHIVTPGFIDGHTHLDAQILWDPLGTSSCLARRHQRGDGQLRLHLAPVPRGRGRLVIESLEKAEDISAAVLAEGVPFRVADVPRVPRRGRPVPEGHQHGGLRRPLGAAHVRDGRAGVRGARDGRRPRPHGAASCDDALDAGAVGFTTSRSRTT